ncbi:MAG: histidine--tRNA ligase [Clostridia bacterium]|nr:histidine--tRNA ligase [Clostridia bacterium]
MQITRPRGTNDFLPEITAKWQEVEALLRCLCREYGYGEIRTPLFEDTELFSRGVGETTDIVQKEMYTFADHGGRSMTLRPENTASACRAYIENKLYGGVQPVKLYYLGPMFRYEKPQAGRFRQFHQFGLELFGSAAPAADAEVISFAWDLYHRLHIKGLQLKINSVGCPACRPAYKTALQDYFRPYLGELCATCRDRFERNPLRIFDCKSEICRRIGAEAPLLLDSLCPECGEHFTAVQELLTTAAIPFELNPRLVRGLDYYTKTAFEIEVAGIGAQSALCGGGRYDGLIEEIGGTPTPAVGFALGMERIFAALAAQNDDIETTGCLDVYIISGMDKRLKQAAFALACRLRGSGISVEMELGDKSFKAQMKAADRLQAAWTVIFGANEFAAGQAAVRNMASGEQIELPIEDIRGYLMQH